VSRVLFYLRFPFVRQPQRAASQKNLHCRKLHHPYALTLGIAERCRYRSRTRKHAPVSKERLCAGLQSCQQAVQRIRHHRHNPIRWGFIYLNGKIYRGASVMLRCRDSRGGLNVITLSPMSMMLLVRMGYAEGVTKSPLPMKFFCIRRDALVVSTHSNG